MDLRSKFVSRKEEFYKSTKDIFSNIQHILDAIVEYMDVKALYERGGKLEWVDISFIDKHVDDPYCILMGNVWYPVGTEIVLENGSKVKVTKETEEYFRKLLRVGLPLKVLESKDKQIALDYLAKTEAEMIEEEDEMRERLHAELERHFGDDDDEELVEAGDFDMSTLTPEQIEQLKLFPKTGRG